MARYPKIEEWFLDYGSDVHHFLAYCVGQNNVEDLVQEVFIKALKGLDRYEGRSGAKTWLFSIARRVAIDYERANRRAGLVSVRLLNERSIAEPLPDEIVFQREELARIYAILKKLKRSYREVVFLRVMEDFSAAETAEILNWSATRVNVTLYRAIRKVRSLYEKTNGGAELAAGK